MQKATAACLLGVLHDVAQYRISILFLGVLKLLVLACFPSTSCFFRVYSCALQPLNDPGATAEGSRSVDAPRGRRFRGGGGGGGSWFCLRFF